MVTSANMYTVGETAVIMGGLILLAIAIGVAVMVAIREDDDRPLIPWGARMRVEKAKAHTAVMQEQLNQDGLEVKRLAVEHHREALVQAIADGIDSQEAYQMALQQLPAGKLRNKYDDPHI